MTTPITHGVSPILRTARYSERMSDTSLATMTAAQRMTRARLFVGIDQAEMAELLGRSRSAVSAWERGINEPTMGDIARWAVATGRSIDWLVWGDEGRPEELESRPRESNPRPSHYE